MSVSTHQAYDDIDPSLMDPVEEKDLGAYFDSLGAEIKVFVEGEKEGLTLFVYEKIGKAAGSLVGLVISAITIFFFIAFASIALALYLGTLVGGAALGFLIVAGIYLLTFLIFHFVARQSIRDSTMLNVINSLYDEND